MSVLKLFGIYTHNKLDHGGLWDAVGRHLQRRGSDHRKRCKDGEFFCAIQCSLFSLRCLARQTSRARDDYYVPKSFPSLPEIYEEETIPTDLDQSQLLKVRLQPCTVFHFH
jgi:hypothetical protein